MFLQSVTPSSVESLQRLMNEMSAEAQARGLTPEILDQIVNEEASARRL
ncbi:MAG: hypothetical protein RMJ55_10355 [Roseiflexaceae bacterium]|nr:hypothetical protein [Roseiflexaceae bacterium]